MRSLPVPFRRRLPAAVLGTVVVLGLAACGSDGGGAATDAVSFGNNQSDQVPKDAITAVLDRADLHPWNPDVLRARAEEFGEARFIERIRAIVDAEGMVD